MRWIGRAVTFDEAVAFILPFGKHAGCPMGSVPDGYLRWLASTTSIPQRIRERASVILCCEADRARRRSVMTDLAKLDSALDTAIALLHLGLWPVAIKPGEKAPIGMNWGRRRPTEAELRRIYNDNPGAGVGVMLGPEADVIDIEGDGRNGETSLTSLMDGVVPETLGWTSRRGPHRLFRYDPRLAAFGSIIKGLPTFPDLEIRIGGLGLQFQSVCPPTAGTDGVKRQWNGHDAVACLPGSRLQCPRNGDQH